MELFHREQILASSRWLFNQEVELLILRKPKTGLWMAIVPKGSSSHSVGNTPGDELILVSHYPSTGAYGTAMAELHETVQKKIGELFTGDPGTKHLILNPLKLPLEPMQINPAPLEPDAVMPSERTKLETQAADLYKRLDTLVAATDTKRDSITTSLDEVKTILQQTNRTLAEIQKNTAVHKETDINPDLAPPGREDCLRAKKAMLEGYRETVTFMQEVDDFNTTTAARGTNPDTTTRQPEHEPSRYIKRARLSGEFTPPSRPNLGLDLSMDLEGGIKRVMGEAMADMADRLLGVDR